jgi:t-SNARE complex subunit (syntaxin)
MIIMNDTIIINDVNRQLDNLLQDQSDLLEISRQLQQIVNENQPSFDIAEENIITADTNVTTSIVELSSNKKSSQLKKIFIIGGITIASTLLGTAGLAISIPVAAAGVVIGAIVGSITGIVINNEIQN